MSRKSLLAFSTMLFAGCATVAPVSTPPYFPSNPSAVLLKHQGEIEASGSVSTGGEMFLAAYALTPHLGVLASGSMALHKSGDPNGNQYSSELGFGIFDTMARTHTYSELYGGAGWGAGSNNVDMYLFDDIYQDFGQVNGKMSGTENRNFWNGWVQADAGYSNGNFSLMMMLRVEYVDIYRDVTKGTLTMQYGINNSTTSDTSYSAQGSFWLLTPGLEARYGFDRIQFVADLFETPNVTGSEDRSTPAMVSLGLCYKF